MASSNFGSSCSSSNLLLVLARNGGAALDGTTPIQDTLGTTFALQQSLTTGSSGYLFAWTGVLGSSGTNAVTANFASTIAFDWIFAIELSTTGTWASPYDTGSATLTGGGTTDIVGGAISTTQASEAVYLAATQAAFTTYTAGTDFTLLANIGGGAGDNYGGVQEYLPNGVLSSYSGHITSTDSSAATVLVIAVKDTAASGPQPGAGAAVIASAGPSLNLVIGLPDEP